MIYHDMTVSTSYQTQWDLKWSTYFLLLDPSLLFPNAKSIICMGKTNNNNKNIYLESRNSFKQRQVLCQRERRQRNIFSQFLLRYLLMTHSHFILRGRVLKVSLVGRIFTIFWFKHYLGVKTQLLLSGTQHIAFREQI